MNPRMLRSALVAVLSCLVTLAQADIRVGVIASSTGPTAVVGIPQKNTVALLPTEVAG